MFNDDLTRLRHMRDAAQKAVRFAQDKTRDALETDEMLTLSLVKCIEIIGEAAARVTRERQLELTQIPWVQVIGMRNRLIHAYFQVDLDIVWNTVIQALPNLILNLEVIIQNEEQE
jgi:uncharacterized protein with HEPN domain